jgi:hypothetical protein
MYKSCLTIYTRYDGYNIQTYLIFFSVATHALLLVSNLSLIIKRQNFRLFSSIHLFGPSSSNNRTMKSIPSELIYICLVPALNYIYTRGRIIKIDHKSLIRGHTWRQDRNRKGVVQDTFNRNRKFVQNYYGLQHEFIIVSDPGKAEKNPETSFFPKDQPGDF